VRLHEVVDLLPAIPWLIPFLTLPRLARRTPDLSDAPAASGPLVSVIVPARNESVTIATVVGSIVATTYRPFELLVVDDRSTDDTAAIVERFTADTRLRLIRGEELPEGWFGKPWACFQGYREARGEILLFTDADTRHEPELLGRAVGALLAERAGLVTVAPVQRCLTFWERIVMPQIWFLLALRYSPSSVNRARRARDVIANGQFILTTRKAYESAGTHEAVRQEVAEDLALAQSYLQKGLKLHFAFAERLMDVPRPCPSGGRLVQEYLPGRAPVISGRAVPARVGAAHVGGGDALLVGAAGDPAHGGYQPKHRALGAGRPPRDGSVGVLLDANLLWDENTGVLRARISDRSAHDTLHRLAIDLAGEWTDRVAGPGIWKAGPVDHRLHGVRPPTPTIFASLARGPAMAEPVTCCSGRPTSGSKSRAMAGICWK
jgi:hypothetical protein